MRPFAECSVHCTLWSQATFKARGTRHESACVRWPLAQTWKADAIPATPNYFRRFLKSSQRTTMSNFEQLKRELDESIQGVNRYNPGNVEQLEKCVSFALVEVSSRFYVKTQNLRRICS